MKDEEEEINENPEQEEQPTSDSGDGAELHGVIPVSGMYENWFLDYASYVILERAVPGIEDGLKPVQRRIMHAMKEMDDGRFNKVANIIGQTMQYHPHGDASIGVAQSTPNTSKFPYTLSKNAGMPFGNMIIGIFGYLLFR